MTDAEIQKRYEDAAKHGWLPIPGVLIKHKETGETEELGDYNQNLGGWAIGSNETRGDNEVLFEEWEPCQELEGLEIGDKVYSIAFPPDSNSNGICEWTISEIDGSLTLKIPGLEMSAIRMDGSHMFVGNRQQFFYRTADRAERLGRGDA